MVPPQPKNSAAAISIAASPSQARARDRRRSALVDITRLRNRSSHSSPTRKPGVTIRGRHRAGAADRAVVVTVTVALAMVVPLTVNELEERLQVDRGAGSEQLSVTVPLKSLVVPATLTEKVAGWPAATVAELEELAEGEMEKSVPVPDNETICGLSVALSTMTSVAVLLPTAVGVNVTVIVQLPPPATPPPHVLLVRKSLVLALIEVMPSDPTPLVVSVMDCPELTPPTGCAMKLRLVAESVTAGGARPTPVSGTLRGLCAELSKICSDADKLPIASGTKTMLNVQVWPTAKLWFCWQLIVEMTKLVGFVPVTEKPFTVNGALPVFVKLTVCVALVVP